MQKLIFLITSTCLLSGCLVTSVVGAAASVAGAAVSTAVTVVDAVTPDIKD
ncbi:hypothetical protein F544_18770 [Bibersteinia trehalosi USDA-ARS-USMARC-190]|uniref:Lipoprotein n=1 Tax=Bibersteinia trehalosi USDA-ARS-USMARC-190 TaxID=1263832 RepID=W0R9W3_BIBTR|nr:hypothetical protein [Bibersteinia trehalosi]AHG87105.1 hypothetical protein F544_18770 [Bibersteinia trehalosi USDA-ARS-USMARC-190]